jgi:hypothetical protein
MLPTKALGQLLATGHLFLTLTQPSSRLSLTQLCAEEKLPCFNLAMPSTWIQLEIGFALQDGRPYAMPATRCALLLGDTLTPTEVRILEQLLQRSDSLGYLLLLAGSERSWESWYTQAQFYTKEKVASLSGASLSVALI